MFIRFREKVEQSKKLKNIRVSAMQKKKDFLLTVK